PGTHQEGRFPADPPASTNIHSRHTVGGQLKRLCVVVEFAFAMCKLVVNLRPWFSSRISCSLALILPRILLVYLYQLLPHAFIQQLLERDGELRCRFPVRQLADWLRLWIYHRIERFPRLVKKKIFSAGCCE